jgi:hypothetical protein
MIFFGASPYLADHEEVKMSKAETFQYFGVLVALTIVGGISSFLLMNDKVRHSLYSGPSGKQLHMDEFNGPAVYHQYQNLEEQRVALLYRIHPKFLDLSSVEDWFTKLTLDNVIFRGKEMPSSINGDLSFEKLFKQMKAIYNKCGEDASQVERIKCKSEELRELLKQRDNDIESAMDEE